MSGGLLRTKVERSIREIVFGVEDSLVSTLGAITGIAAGTGDTQIVILSGVVLVFVEALSMSAGSYLSSKSAREVFDARLKQESSRILQERVSDDESIEDMLQRKKFSRNEIQVFFEALSRERKLWMREIRRQEYRFAPSVSVTPVWSGVVMGVCYLGGGMFPLVPYLFLPVSSAMIPSIVLTAVMLFILGLVKARIAKVNWWKSGLEMVSISITAALVGFLIGHFLSLMFGLQSI